ncbi:hypothetical protein ETI06_04735 [Macrococcoides goetzii]|uniref:hypothetical protein n=1 Tax=Macrococcoides bohemicum TaxID=1903056 RepID=UPI000BB59209|nr:hypothetical protein [Macrococcus]ATD30051.1 hypothetical protein BHM04_02200 [Macrococcus sp. IME1552]MBC9873765.1 hypothetical protein [Macrococcus bohemicus]TDM39817.1 hypothetical protein ETI10_10250 [Macrococcus goetzii]TDM46296.1 hypothetical protein ETI08_06335 [Macrococcus goetzii]TDM49782.1 hypothetical protein ETI06_04735 [Macrococcus goetzii]
MKAFTKGLIVIIMLSLIMIISLVATKRYFNQQEIDILVEGAEARGIDYEVIITNELTKAYKFEAKSS